MSQTQEFNSLFLISKDHPNVLLPITCTNFEFDNSSCYLLIHTSFNGLTPEETGILQPVIEQDAQWWKDEKFETLLSKVGSLDMYGWEGDKAGDVAMQALWQVMNERPQVAGRDLAGKSGLNMWALEEGQQISSDGLTYWLEEMKNGRDPSQVIPADDQAERQIQETDVVAPIAQAVQTASLQENDKDLPFHNLREVPSLDLEGVDAEDHEAAPQAPRSHPRKTRYMQTGMNIQINEGVGPAKPTGKQKKQWNLDSIISANNVNIRHANSTAAPPEEQAEEIAELPTSHVRATKQQRPETPDDEPKVASLFQPDGGEEGGAPRTAEPVTEEMLDQGYNQAGWKL